MSQVNQPRIRPVERNECNPEQLKLLESLGPAGNMNAFKTLIRQPKLFQRLVSSVQYVMQESTIPARDRESLILRTAWLCKAEYEWSHHSINGKQAGLSDEEILRVTKGARAKGWTSFDAALLQAADELRGDACISDSTWKALAEKYTQQQMMELVFTVAMYNLASMLLNSFRVELDQNVTGFPK